MTHEAAEFALTKARAEWEQTGRDEAKRPRAYYHEENTGKYRDQLEQKMKTVGGVNGDAAFVTFDNALDCSKAIGLNFSHHRDEEM